MEAEHAMNVALALSDAEHALDQALELACDHRREDWATSIVQASAQLWALRRAIEGRLIT